MPDYLNRANSDHPGLIIYLIDVSGSMAKPLGNTTRIDAVEKALNATYNELASRCLSQDVIHERYRIGLFAYSDDVYDVYSGIHPINEILELGTPELHVQNRTRMDFGFKVIRDVLIKELSNWDQDQIINCPAPLLVHMTDAEINDKYPDPEPFVREIMQMKLANGKQIPDGNILVENIYITDQIQFPTIDQKLFRGFPVGQPTGNPIADKLLRMSSKLPDTYKRRIDEDLKKSYDLALDSGVAMLLPGTSPELVKKAFVMSSVTGGKNEQWETD